MQECEKYYGAFYCCSFVSIYFCSIKKTLYYPFSQKCDSVGRYRKESVQQNRFFNESDISTSETGIKTSGADTPSPWLSVCCQREARCSGPRWSSSSGSAGAFCLHPDRLERRAGCDGWRRPLTYGRSLLRRASESTAAAMPNQKSGKGKRNKRTNSSGDEQENGASAATAAAATAATAAATAAAAASGGGGAQGAVGATAGAAAAQLTDNREAPCATPLVCSLGRPVDLEKDDYQRVLCNSEHCPYGNWMHLQCFYEWESSILAQFNCIGRARSWNEKQCRQNMWTKKGYDLAFRFCSCRCGQGHLKKDTDWYQVKRMQDDRKKKVLPEKSGAKSREAGASGGCSGESSEEPKKGKSSSKLAHRGSNQELSRRQSMERQNSQERCHMGAACDSPGQSPPSGFSFFSPQQAGGPRSSRHLGEFLKSAVHMEGGRKHILTTRGGAHPDHGAAVAAAGLCLPRLAAGDNPVQFLRRLDLSELLTHIPRHKLNTYHVRMEDDAQAGQGEDLRKFILSALSASHRNVVHCALCHRTLPIFEQFPLVDGTLFLSPSRHEEIEYDVPCHLQGRLMHLYAICVDCLEGVHKIVCIKCKSRWDGSWHQLGTMYTYDILAASPCCQARLNCKHCGKPVIDVRVGMQYFSEYSNVQQCPHCGNLDYHFVKPFSSFKVLEAY
uniref:Hdc homolog, cell cycle regulator n=1 Tax=Astyanax mexicanus TaxID=7994 RepID=A0A3B1J7E9_ASTMX